MQTALYLLASTVAVFLNVLYVAMFLEAVLSWFLPEDHILMTVLTTLTAPVVFPVRMLLSRVPVIAELPIDLSFLVAFLLLGFVSGSLPALTMP